MTFNWNHDRKYGRSARGYPGRAMTNDSRRLQHCRTVLSDELIMRHIVAKFVPRLMSSDQNDYYDLAVCTELKEQAENDPNYISNVFGVGVRSQDEAAVISLEDSNFTTTEESTTRSEQCQFNVDFFFALKAL